MKIKINELNMELQTRAETSKETVAEYAELMRDGREFPPVTVFRVKSDSNPIWLVDGFHRVAAMRENGHDEIEANVIYGDHSAALTYALKANSKHGRQLTNADKRRVLQIAWDNRFELFPELVNENGEIGQISSAQLARICGISKSFVKKFIKNYKEVDTCPPPQDDEPSDKVVRNNLKKGLDRFGVQIPEHLAAIFNSKASKLMLGDLRKVKTQLANAQENADMSVIGYHQYLTIDVEKAINDIKFGHPYCVCPACGGRSGGCGYCSGRGFQNKGQFRRTPSDFKAVKEADK